LNQYGYGQEYSHARIIWYADSKQVKSYSLNTKLYGDDEQQTDLRATLDVLFQMVGEVRRFTSVQNDTVEIMAKSNQKLVERNMELREEVMEERTTALALDLAIQESEKDSEIDYKERAFATLSHLGEVLISTKQNQLTPESFKKLMAQHPELIDVMMEDEEVVKMIGTRFMSRKESDNVK